MILMSKYKGQHGGKKGQKIRAGPPSPFSGNARKKSIFSMGGVPLYQFFQDFSEYIHDMLCLLYWIYADKLLVDKHRDVKVGEKSRAGQGGGVTA